MSARDRLSRFLEHLDAIFQTEPEFFPIESLNPGLPKLACMVYRDIPEANHVTGVTYGLSEADHPSWHTGKPELIVSVESTDVAWPLSVAEMANQLRGECPFGYGNVVDYGGKICEESDMSAFFVFAPAILQPSAFLGIDVGAERALNLAGMYPFYDSERALLAEVGLERFLRSPNLDLYDVRRAALTSAAIPR